MSSNTSLGKNIKCVDNDTSEITFSLTNRTETYILVKSTSVDIILKPMMRIMLEETSELVSFTKSPDEISLIISKPSFTKYFINDDEINQKIENCDIYSTEDYNALSFNTSGLLECAGVLQILTGIFAKYDISILCLSTYAYNYILFPSCQVDRFHKMIDGNKKMIDYNNIAHPLMNELK